MRRVRRARWPRRNPIPMDVDKVLECLNEALELQHRSILAVQPRLRQRCSASRCRRSRPTCGSSRRPSSTTPAGSSRRSRRSAATRRRRSPKVELEQRPGEGHRRADRDEDEAIAALHAVIPHSGQEPRSEALEHLMEHLIMRKQNQVDWLRRARRTALGVVADADRRSPRRPRAPPAAPRRRGRASGSGGSGRRGRRPATSMTTPPASSTSGHQKSVSSPLSPTTRMNSTG